MAGSPGETHTASGAEGFGEGERGKRPMPPSGKVKGICVFHCVLCQTMTDHCATECPYVCHCCGERGHWVCSCTSVLCDWCHKKAIT